MHELARGGAHAQVGRTQRPESPVRTPQHALHQQRLDAARLLRHGRGRLQL